MTDVAVDNRVTTAVRLARIDEKLGALTKQVEVALKDAKQERRGHSQRLDAFELTLARMEQGKRERAQLQDDVKAIEGDVKKLWREQRIWSGVNTVLGPLLAAITAWLNRGN